MRRPDKGWLITAAVILLVIYVWFLTFQDGNRILNKGRNEREPAPYYSKEHGETEKTNP